MNIFSFSYIIRAGQFLLDSSRFDEAAVEYERAAELAPGDIDAILNAANALRQAGLNDKAEQFYRRAVQLHPSVSVVFSTLYSYNIYLFIFRNR
jgi:tetratricopeptide (TPR) repeat protein